MTTYKVQLVGSSQTFTYHAASREQVVGMHMRAFGMEGTRVFDVLSKAPAAGTVSVRCYANLSGNCFTYGLEHRQLEHRLREQQRHLIREAWGRVEKAIQQGLDVSPDGKATRSALRDWKPGMRLERTVPMRLADDLTNDVVDMTLGLPASAGAKALRVADRYQSYSKDLARILVRCVSCEVVLPCDCPPPAKSTCDNVSVADEAPETPPAAPEGQLFWEGNHLCVRSGELATRLAFICKDKTPGHFAVGIWHWHAIEGAAWKRTLEFSAPTREACLGILRILLESKGVVMPEFPENGMINPPERA